MKEIEGAFLQRGFENDPRRKHALDLFSSKGFPGPKSEEYKFTPISKLLEKVLVLDPINSSQIDVGTSLLITKDHKCNLVAFVNGQFSKEKSVILDEDVKIRFGEMGDAKVESDPFDLLNQAFSHSIIQIDIGEKKAIKHPLAIVHHIDSPQFTFANPRWRCNLGAESSLSLIEYTISSKGSLYFNNKQSTIEVAENSQLEYTLIQNGPDHDIQVNNTSIHLSNSAKANCFAFTFDGQLIRNNLSLTIDGSGVEAHLYGLYLLSKKTIADNHTVVDHKQSNSHSNELYKGVMDGDSKGIFNGKIYVRPQAQKTNAFQSNRNILLSETATVNTKPQLEIWADDVKCSHGCTTGQLDEEALFYLRSRGISKDQAKGMLLNAFAGEAIVAMKNEIIRGFVDGLVLEKLQKNF